MPWFPFLFFGLFALIAIVAVIVHSVNRKKRTEAWQRTATELGLPFIGDDNGVPARLGQMKTFSRGHSRRFTNAIAGDAGDVRITLGDYRYTTGSGKSKSTHSQTICILEANQLHAPRCFLRPQIRFFDAIGAMLGGQDIDFADDRDFSGAYVLQGDSEEAVRRQFDERLRAWFAARKANRFQFEAAGNTIVFHTGRLRKPEEAREIMQDALQIMKLLAKEEEA